MCLQTLLRRPKQLNSTYRVYYFVCKKTIYIICNLCNTVVTGIILGLVFHLLIYSFFLPVLNIQDIQRRKIFLYKIHFTYWVPFVQCFICMCVRYTLCNNFNLAPQAMLYTFVYLFTCMLCVCWLHVAGVVGRAECLSALFYLLAFLTYRHSLKQNIGG